MFWIFLYSGIYIAWYTCFGYFCTVESILRGIYVLDIFVLWNLYCVVHMFWIFLYCGINIAGYTCFGYFCTVESILRGIHFQGSYGSISSNNANINKYDFQSLCTLPQNSLICSCKCFIAHG